METLFQFLIGFFWQLWPFSRINPWEKGLLIELGQWTHPLEPGVFWRFPLVQEIEVFHAYGRWLDLPNQPLLTADGYPMDVSGLVEFELEDVDKMRRMVQPDHEDAIKSRAMVAIAEFLPYTNFEDIDPETVEQAVLEPVRVWARERGITILSIGFTHLVDTTCHYLTGDSTLASLG